MTQDKSVEIRQALARGYCSKENEQKVLDPELIEAMAIEVEQTLAQYHQDTMSEVVERIEKAKVEADKFVPFQAIHHKEGLTEAQTIIKLLSK